MLGIEELNDISAIIQDTFNDRLEEILTKLNRTGQLEDFLTLIGMRELIGSTSEASSNKYGVIIVIGQSEVEKEKLAAVAKSIGFDKSRFEFYLGYEDAKTFNFKKTQYNDAYSAILVGPVPHSGIAKGDYSSIITALKREDGYPPVESIGTNGLKITKTSFKMTLERLLEDRIVA